jgi:hypothetical protein
MRLARVSVFSAVTIEADMLAPLIDTLFEYCSRAETREALESKVITPLVRYLAERFSWAVRVFQIVAVLVFSQTLMLVWLLAREIRRP